MDLSHLSMIEQILVGIFMIILFCAWIALIIFIIWLSYLEITNIIMLNKWLRKQMQKDEQESIEKKQG